MRFSNYFFALLAASYAFSHSIPNEKRNENDENDLGDYIEGVVDDAVNDFANEITKSLNAEEIEKWFSDNDSACDKAFEQYEECFADDSKITEENIDEVCNTLNSEKCQNFFMNGINAIPECQKVEGFEKVIMDHITMFGDISIKLTCTKDENGQYCPLSEFILSEKNKYNFSIVDKDDKLFNEAVDNTCKSKICTDVYLSAFTELKSFRDNLNSIFSTFGSELSSKEKRQIEDQKSEEDKLLNDAELYLKSENCTALKANIEALTNDASSTFKFGSAMFIGFVLLIFTLI